MSLDGAITNLASFRSCRGVRPRQERDCRPGAGNQGRRWCNGRSTYGFLFSVTGGPWRGLITGCCAATSAWRRCWTCWALLLDTRRIEEWIMHLQTGPFGLYRNRGIKR